MRLRVTTWNLQGRARPDLEAVASVLGGLEPDVVLLQEVQRRQAQRVAATLRWTVAWRRKHWPVVIPAEGLAVLAPEVRDPHRTVLAHRWRFWSSRRRIAVEATVGVGVSVVSVHLGSGVGDDERVRQARIVTGLGAGVVGGDLNTRPGSPVLDAFAEHGYVDAWSALHPDEPGATNWGRSPRDGPAVQRLDYLLPGPAWQVVDIEVPAFGDPGFDRFGALSDHLPVTATLEPAPLVEDRPDPVDS